MEQLTAWQVPETFGAGEGYRTLVLSLKDYTASGEATRSNGFAPDGRQFGALPETVVEVTGERAGAPPRELQRLARAQLEHVRAGRVRLRSRTHGRVAADGDRLGLSPTTAGRSGSPRPARMSTFRSPDTSV